MTFEEFQSKTRFANLDGVRFLSISAVIWHHAIPDGVRAFPLSGRGFLGVDFFFVLSGFLITTLLLREKSQTGTISLRGFYLKRVLRILPVYLFVVGMVALYYIGVKGQSDYLRLMPYYLVFMNNFLTEHIPLLSVTWSLAVEEHFYFIWPVLLVLLPIRYLLSLAVIVILVNVAGIMGAFGGSDLRFGPLHFALPPATYAPIIMGAVLAVVLNLRQSFDLIEKALGGAAAGLVALGALILVIWLAPQDLRGLPNLLIHSLMTLTLAALVVREDNLGLRWLQSNWVVRIGVVSYGIYLYHLIALDITSRGLSVAGINNDWLILIVYYGISFLVADISFRTLEAYFRRFRPKHTPG